MRPKIREILEECIERGVEDGYLKAHKHDENPRAFHIYEQIESAIWLEIDERFDFERNVCNEVVEGFDHLEKGREWVGLTDEERSQIHNNFIHKKIGIWEVCDLCEAKLKEKNT